MIKIKKLLFLYHAAPNIFRWVIRVLAAKRLATPDIEYRRKNLFEIKQKRP